jgi:hypothetical protein
LLAGEVIGVYDGEYMSQAMLDARYGRDECAAYTLKLNDDTFIDGRHSGHWTTKINDPHASRFRENIRLLGTGWLQVARGIARGQELMMSYGPEFPWDERPSSGPVPVGDVRTKKRRRNVPHKKAAADGTEPLKDTDLCSAKATTEVAWE